MSVFGRVFRSVKKYVHNIAGIKKASPLNPLTHGYHTIRKISRGLRHKRWQGNVQKVVMGGSRRAVNGRGVYYFGGADYGPAYVHTARTLSQLTGGR